MRKLMVCLLLLSGCSSPMVWNKAGASDSQMKDDTAACARQAEQRIPEVDPHDAVSAGDVRLKERQQQNVEGRRQEFRSACMSDKGYQLQRW